MINKIMTVICAGAVASALALSAAADTISAPGGEITYTGADVKTLSNGDVVLVFTNTEEQGTFSLPKTAKARIMLVGGGGAGGSMGYTVDRGAAGGGGAGGMVDRDQILEKGNYSVNVGTGGMRVQTVVQSWTGDDGEISEIFFGSERLASVRGGGGGGAVKLNGYGSDGGSGGGGSWYSTFLTGGLGTEGHGWAGATPNNENYGGGGGGASKDSIAGRGKENGEGGAGRASDITGENVVYANGGRGGVRGSDSYVPQDGAIYGAGGDGAISKGDGVARNENYGGGGANGIVVVRIYSLFDYTKIPYPTFTDLFIWTNNTTYTVFDATKVAEPLKSAIDRVEGETSVTTSLRGEGETAEMVGASRHNFVVYLKEEYVWDDGTDDGVGGPFIGYWRIRDEDSVSDAQIDIKKTVSWSDGENAVISIEVHAVPEQKKADPKVLVLGALCGAHGLKSSIVNTMLNTICEVGSVDYFYYSKVTGTSATPGFEGSMAKGQTRTGNIMVGTKNLDNVEANHGTLYGFYLKLGELMDDGTLDEYDYIVFSFDCTQVATYFPSAHPQEGAIAAKLKEFYKKNRVIWFHDNDAPENAALGISQNPWFPSPMTWVAGSSYNYWRSLGYYQYQWGENKTQPYGYSAYKALMGIFAPDKYESINESTYDPLMTTKTTSSGWNRTTTEAVDGLTYNGVMSQAGTAIANQEVYDDADKVAELISRVVKATGTTVSLKDKVGAQMGLSVQNIEAEWTTNDVNQAWTPVTDDEICVTDEGGVEINITNLWNEAYMKVDIAVKDTGMFRSSIGATYNEHTGLWEKDPNDGPVDTRMIPDGGEELLAEDKAATAVAWSFKAFKITGCVVHGEGEFVINGFVTNCVSVGAGYTPELIFRGAAGWVLDYLEVDGEVKPYNKETYNWFFENINADHDVKVGFRNILIPPYPNTDPVVTNYDGYAYGCKLNGEPVFLDGYDFDYDVAYSLTPDGPFTETNGLINVGTTNVYIRLKIDQPGYENGVILDNWTGVNTVTVLPREIEVTFDDYVQSNGTNAKTTGFTYQVTGGELVPGDSLDYNSGRVDNRPNTAGGTPGTITANGTMNITTPGFDGSNYIITVVPGKYYYPAFDVLADAEDVTVVYDAAAHSSAATVVYDPINTSGEKEITRTSATTNRITNANTSTRYNDSTGQETTSSWGSTRYYAVETNDTATATTVYTTDTSILYSLTEDGEYTKTLPTFTDAGEHTVYYKVVSYSNEVTTTVHNWQLTGQTSSGTGSNAKKSRKNIPGQYAHGTYTVNSDPLEFYSEATGSMKVTVLPRPVEVTASSANKDYDGTALTSAAYAVADATDTTGFIGTDGIQSAAMTTGSTITDPGVVANTINQSSVVLKPGTNPANYAITYVDGELAVTKNQLQANAPGDEKAYDGNPTASLNVTVLDKDGNPLPTGSYTIKYALNPWDEFTSEKPAAPVNAGEYNYFYVVDGGAGYGVVTNYATFTVTPLEAVITAGSEKRSYNGEPLTNGEFTVTGLINGDKIESVTMTGDSIVEFIGTNANKIATWTMSDGAYAQNYHFTTVDGLLTVVASIMPVIPADDPQGPAYTGNMNDPDDPHSTVYKFQDDFDNPWLVTIIDDAPGSSTSKSKDDYCGGSPELGPGETSTLIFTVEGDGEFRWDSLVDTKGANPANVKVYVDGKLYQNYGAESSWTDHVIHVLDAEGEDGAEHEIKIVYTNDGNEGDSRMYIDNIEFTPSATATEVYGIVVNTEPPSENVEDIKKVISIYNDEESGWMPVFDDKGDVVALRSADGTEGTTPGADMSSTISLGVNGSGEVKVGSITIPVKDDESVNPDHGLMTIAIDDTVYVIPPIPDDNVSYDVYYVDDQIIVSNLVIKVLMDETTNSVSHVITFTYTRDADDPTGNTAAIIENITWKTYGESDDGGTTWMDDGQALMIVDHEDPQNGEIYLAFDPQLKYDEEITNWVSRTFKKGKLRVKRGASRAAAYEDHQMGNLSISDKVGHKISPHKVWIKVNKNDVTDSDVGFWRIFVDGPAIKYKDAESETEIESETDGGALSVNTFGIIEVQSVTTNTMIAVPWTWYSALEKNAKDIPVNKLVKTENLTEGDQLYAYAGNGTYAIWELIDEEWVLGSTEKVNSAGDSETVIIGGETIDNFTISRGLGLWLSRQNPTDKDGNPIPFWLYGQSIKAGVTTTVIGGSSSMPSFTMLGNPFCYEVSINDLVMTGNIGSNDRIAIPRGGDAILYMQYKSGKGWYYTEVTGSGSSMKSTRKYDMKIAPGLAFWYTRRTAGDLTVQWEEKEIEKGTK